MPYDQGQKILVAAQNQNKEKEELLKRLGGAEQRQILNLVEKHLGTDIYSNEKKMELGQKRAARQLPPAPIQNPKRQKKEEEVKLISDPKKKDRLVVKIDMKNEQITSNQGVQQMNKVESLPEPKDFKIQFQQKELQKIAE